MWLALLLLGVPQDLADELRKLDARVLPADAENARRLGRDVRARLQEANDRESAAWRAIKTREDWERYRDGKIKALRASLGTLPEPPADLKARVTKTIEADGYRIDNVVFESRPGLLVTANLYRPAAPPASMPGILVIHSHHNPKTQGELQDMGVTWALAGCMVLVMDQLGHGERRQHPFIDATSYKGSFRPTRQDYYFRYNVALQLSAIGESLVGWMAWDLMRGVDLLLARGADKGKIALLGSVAGGGDPAGVTAALDPRITAVVPFNFGGPQPESKYPLPGDAEFSFNYAGSGSWESTRNLALSARDGFLPWVIVGSVAPRHLIHAHEFAWDRERDPVWKRYQSIWGFYGAGDKLDAAHGRGGLSGQPPEATHCNNIGAEHRKMIHPAFERWFGIRATEAQDRRAAAELACLAPDIKPTPLHEIAARIGSERAAAAKDRRAKLGRERRRERLREDWKRLLGDIEPGDPKLVSVAESRVGEVSVEHVTLHVDRDFPIPLVLLRPAGARSVVVAFAQQGKQTFLKNRAGQVAELLKEGIAVCLADLRGTGETAPESGSRSRSSASTSISASELMLGQTLFGSRLRDLRSVLRYVRVKFAGNDRSLGLWGESFAEANARDREFAAPLDANGHVTIAEPLGAHLALFGALFEDDIRAAYGGGPLSGFASILDGPFVYVPHDAIVPGAVAVGDLREVAESLEQVLLDHDVDGANREVIPGRFGANAAVSQLKKLRR
jgi:dienelactone hydrolase